MLFDARKFLCKNTKNYAKIKNIQMIGETITGESEHEKNRKEKYRTFFSHDVDPYGDFAATFLEYERAEDL